MREREIRAELANECDDEAVRAPTVRTKLLIGWFYPCLEESYRGC